MPQKQFSDRYISVCCQAFSQWLCFPVLVLKTMFWLYECWVCFCKKLLTITQGRHFAHRVAPGHSPLCPATCLCTLTACLTPQTRCLGVACVRSSARSSCGWTNCYYWQAAMAKPNKARRCSPAEILSLCHHQGHHTTTLLWHGEWRIQSRVWCCNAHSDVMGRMFGCCAPKMAHGCQCKSELWPIVALSLQQRSKIQ